MKVERLAHPVNSSAAAANTTSGAENTAVGAMSLVSNQVGFIAQEVEQIVPSVVVTGPDGYKSVDYAKLTPLLVEALKTQQEEIRAVKARVEALEGPRSRWGWLERP